VTASPKLDRVHRNQRPEVWAIVRLVQQRSRRRAGDPEAERGQSLVEFSLILMPLFLILLGIIQFGFIFNTYVTMTNAARDAARLGTIYVYDRSSGMTKATNDLARNESIRAQIKTSMNGLSIVAPRFATGTTWTQTTSGTTTTFTNGDLVITYSIPDGSGGDPAVTDSDPRTGQRITVTATYHQDLIIPLISALLPKDASGRMGLGGVVTMVIN
jgi:Flp pilus assembly protein TadG